MDIVTYIQSLLDEGYVVAKASLESDISELVGVLDVNGTSVTCTATSNAYTELLTSGDQVVGRVRGLLPPPSE